MSGAGSPIPRSLWTSWSGSIAIALLAGLVAVVLVRHVAVVRVAENWTRDLRTAVLSPRHEQTPEVAVVAIDEDSLAALPYQSPVDRAFLAELIESLESKGVAAIGVDILVDRATESSKDDALAATIAAARVPVVMAWASAEHGLGKSRAEYLDTALGDARRGLITVVEDPMDGVVRAVPVAPGEDRVAGFAAALADAAARRVPDLDLLEIDYRRGPAPSVPYVASYPAHAVSVVPDEWLRGRLVLIGAELALADRHRTPLSLFSRAGARDSAGVHLHAQALAQILEGRRPGRPSAIAEAAMTLALAAAGVLLALTPAPLWTTATLMVAALAALWLGALAGYGQGAPMVPLVMPSLAFLMGAGTSSALRLRHERDARRYVQQAFSKYLAPAVVRRLVATPERLRVGGERREMTFVFTDLAGFTSLVEGMQAEPLVTLLNEYLDGACRVVMEHDGTLDKIVGDALHVIFNAPLDQPDHPERGVRCALALDSFARGFVARQALGGVPFGETRIGVHTGPAVVGNFGGASRFDYTAHGDAINTAARLEGANKHLGTRMLVSGTTAAWCAQVKLRPVGVLVLKGKRQGLEVFEPIDPDGLDQERLDRYLAAYEQLGCEDSHARQAFESLAVDFPGDSLVAYHAKRIAGGDDAKVIVLQEK